LEVLSSLLRALNDSRDCDYESLLARTPLLAFLYDTQKGGGEDFEGGGQEGGFVEGDYLIEVPCTVPDLL
jgi:hypothetical protein